MTTEDWVTLVLLASACSFIGGLEVAWRLLRWRSRPTPPTTAPLHVCPLDGGYCACVPPFGCQPRMSDYSTLTAIAHRHNTDPAARN